MTTPSPEGASLKPPNPLAVDPRRVLDDLKTLAGFGRVGAGVERRALTAPDIEARHWLCARMADAGLAAEIDGVGSVIGRTPGRERYLVIGSHTDSVPKGGWLDGALGVIFGLEIARACAASSAGDGLGIEVVSFNDEEGRFTGLLGSKVYAGALDPADAAGLTADDGTTLADALAAAGFAGRGVARLDPRLHAGYLEAHIEQGPVLEAAGKRIGIVTEIVGVGRAAVTFSGESDHAGTTPMHLRRDAAAALFDCAQTFAAFCRDEGGPRTVWNLGKVALDPGAYNVVTREATLGIEFRDGDRSVLARLRSAVTETAQAAAARHGVTCSVTDTMSTEPIAMHEACMGHLEDAAKAVGVEPLRMPSGAGHDAMAIAPHVPTGMLFIPSIGGKSHDLTEDTSEADIALGLEVFAGAVSRIRADGL